MKKGLKAWIEIERKDWKKTQALDISSAEARVVPDLLILSDTTVRRSAVDQEDLDIDFISEIRKRPHFCR